MTLMTSISKLTTSVDQLTGEANVTKAQLDAKVALADAEVVGALAEQAATEAARDEAAAHAATAATHLATVKAGVTYQGIGAILAEKAVTAVDVFVYDTSLDSDGGAWRHRCQHTSWYNEPLNTITRGARREFPAVAAIVAEDSKITIYDGDDPALPMWMVFNDGNFTIIPTNYFSPGSHASIAALNGILCAGGNGSAIKRVSFLGDEGDLVGNSYFEYKGNISDRNRTDLDFRQVSATPRIVNVTVNDVAMTVLPDAPIDQATGLPVPTIAVATAGGVSVIKDDGTVVSDAVIFFSGHGYVYNCTIAGENLYVTSWNGGNQNNLSVFDVRTLSELDRYTAFPSLYTSPTPFNNQNLAELSYGSGQLYIGTGNAGGLSPKGVGIIAENTSTPTSGMSALLTSTYNTGWMPGDTKGAFLSDTDDTDLVGGTDADRSVNANPLTVNGTITRSPVETGADLVSYSGFSASNYLEQPYNPDLDFGTGDFCVMGWCKNLGNSTERFLFRFDGFDTSDASGWDFRIKAYDDLEFSVGAAGINVAGSVPASGWSLYAAVRESGVIRLFVNGEEVGSTSFTADVSYPNSVIRIGSGYLGVAGRAPLALWRISATAPTAEQIKRIYEDEKVLFQPGAQCTLFGASDGVTALAHDPKTNLLHVGTSAGRSTFDGLQRVANTETPVGTAISAVNGLIVEG